MASLKRVSGLVRDSLREIERRLIRPLGQRLRPARARRAGGARAVPPGTEELLVALLRGRLRETPRIEARQSDEGLLVSLRALDRTESDVGSLVRALLSVPPRRAAADPETSRKAA